MFPLGVNRKHVTIHDRNHTGLKVKNQLFTKEEPSLKVILLASQFVKIHSNVKILLSYGSPLKLTWQKKIAHLIFIVNLSFFYLQIFSLFIFID